MGIVSNRWRVEDEKITEKKPDPQITNEFVAGQNSVIITMLNQLHSENKVNHRENTQKIDGIASNTSSIRNDVDRLGVRVTNLETHKAQEVDPIVNAHKKRKWIWLGLGLGTGGVTSPAWVPKIVAALNAVFP
jgi:hypothetical protein